MEETLERWRRRIHVVFEDELWEPETSLPHGLRWLRAALQIVVTAARRIVTDRLLLRASALTYFALLALVPLLALALSVVEALGVRRDLAAVIVRHVAAGSPQAASRILQLVEHVDFGRLGTFGAVALFVTTVLGITNVERALNQIWGVQRERPLIRRFSDYLAVLIVAPLLLGVALSLAATLQSQTLLGWLLAVPGFERAFHLGLRQVPTAMLWIAFSFTYWFLPNTNVRVWSAAFGGVVAALLFAAAQHLYVGFNVGVARYNVLFGGLAALPLLLVWIYLSWIVVLLGAEVAFAHQNLAVLRRSHRGEPPGPAAREAVGLAVAGEVARAFREGRGVQDAEQLADALGVSTRAVRSVLMDLEKAGIVTTAGDGEREGFQLGRAAETVRVAAVLDALRGSRETAALAGPDREVVRGILARIDRATQQELAGRTLSDLADVDRSPAAD